MIGITKSYRNGWYIKTGTIQNEVEAYKRMQRFVPEHHIEGNSIYIDKIVETPVIDKVKFMSNYEDVLLELEKNNIEHADLTQYNLIANNDNVYLIDFAESRIDGKGKLKRPEGDRYWLLRAMLYKCNGENVNSRADDMFYHVYNELKITNYKTITDYGCGYGDMSLKSICMGYDLVSCDKEIYTDKIKVNKCDIEEISSYSQISFCFSVLPYLKDPDKLLNTMRKMHEVSFIEWQYKDDGPGTLTKDEVNNILSVVFNSAEVIGNSYIQDRYCYRDIWMCK